MKVIALIGDVVSSQTITNRNSFQKQLKEVLDHVNRDHKEILSPYTITLGDEFQAVYKNAHRLFLDILTILSQIFPQKLRFSIGIGEIVTPINRKQAIGMDGPAFYYARKGITNLKETTFLLDFTADDIPNSNFITNSLYLLSHLINNWTKNRLKILVAIMKGLTVKEIKELLNISHVAIYKNINAGQIKIIINMLNEISLILNHSLEQS